MENKPFYNSKEDSAHQDHITSSNQPGEETNVLQDSILQDVSDMTGYDKNLKNARIWLYVITGMQMVLGVYEYVKYDTLDDAVRWLTFGIDAGIGLGFLACALWSYKKPVVAFLSALILYIVISAGLIILDPVNITSGIIIKIFVVIALVRAYKDAREMEEMKQALVG